MARNENELFERLRQVGLRKQVAKTLSEIGEGAGKKARSAARSAVDELRSVANEIERRVPGDTQIASAGRKRASRTTTRSTPNTRAASSGRRTTAAPAEKPAPASNNFARAPRGQNKAKILESLKDGPKTASVIAKETGIGTGTVGSTLSKLATSGEVVKAERGYGLPSQT